MKKTNVAIFVSESGGDIKGLLLSGIRAALGIKSANIKVVLSNTPITFFARQLLRLFFSLEVVDHKNYANREEFEAELINRIEKYDIGLVVLAGFNRILTPYFIKHYNDRIINIHPGLLPSFPGLGACKQALEYGVKVAGCTAHFVDEGVDTGPIILQATVDVEENDTEKTLLKKIIMEELRIGAEAIQLFCEGRLSISGRKVYIKP